MRDLIWSAECGHYELYRYFCGSGGVRYELCNNRSDGRQRMTGVFQTLKDGKAEADARCRKMKCPRSLPRLMWTEDCRDAWRSGPFSITRFRRKAGGERSDTYFDLRQSDRRRGLYETLADAQAKAEIYAERLARA